MAANILLVVLFISAIVISILVLLQNKGGDMGSAFGGGSNTLFGARGSADFLTRATSITAIVFFLSALALAYIYANQGRQSSDSVIQAIEQTADPAIESDIPDASDIGDSATPPAVTEDAAEGTAPPAEADENDLPAVPE